MGTRTYNHKKYHNIMLPIDLIEELKSMKQGTESFTDLLRRLLKELESLRNEVIETRG